MGLSADECSPQISPDFVQNLADRTCAEENLGNRRWRIRKEKLRCYTSSSMENKEYDSFRLIWTSPRSCRTVGCSSRAVISLSGSMSRWSSAGRCLLLLLSGSGPLKATYWSSYERQPSSPLSSFIPPESKSILRLIHWRKWAIFVSRTTQPADTLSWLFVLSAPRCSSLSSWCGDLNFSSDF